MVEWKKLGELCRIRTGKLNANAQEENGIYPFFTCDSKPYKINNYAFDTEAILISGNGSQVGHLNYYKGKFNAYQRTYVLDDFHGHIFFILHYLKCRIREYIFEKSKKGSVPYITLPMLTDFLIPIPSLEEQERIVGILDTFTASIDNIKAQIEQRHKQYEHYRNTLLTFNKDDDSVEWKTLREVFNTRNGYTPSTTNEKFWKEGTIPWFKMEDIRDKGNILSDSYLHITPLAVKGKGLFKSNSIILATSATIGEHALILTDFLCNQRFTNFSLKEKYSDEVDMKFIYYYMFIIDEWCKQHINQGGFASVDMTELYNLTIPIPSLARQQEIVSILDTFEASITNLKAQLEQRQKQYEYYREELLTNLS